MRNPAEVLNNLRKQAKDKTYKFKRLYRNLYNPEFYYAAYRNIYANKGSLTPGSDGTTVDGIGEKRIQRIIRSLENQQYKPNPARRTYIAKKNNPTKKRPLGIPSGDDKLIQEIVYMMLEAIYEPIFSEHSHGFRPNRSCHTALGEIERTFTGATWFIEGDITACFDSFDHHVLTELLRKRIDDEKFISLVWKFLKAGYLEQWQYHSTQSGTPQGSGASPVLANIYLHELDTFMETLKSEFTENKTDKTTRNTEYRKLENAAISYRKKNNKEWVDLSESERKERAQILRGMKLKVLDTPSRPYRNVNFKSLRYVRYADDFIIGIIGSKSDAQLLKEKINNYLSDMLKLTLSCEKTKITHTTDRARFLGYDIKVSRDKSFKRIKNGTKRRVHSYNVNLLVPHEKWVSKLQSYNAIKIKKDTNGKEKWFAIHRNEFVNLPDIEILSRYNSEVRGLYNYYSIALNASVIGQFGRLMKYSMLKTFACKYRTRLSEIKKRYIRGGNFAISYLTKSGTKQMVFFNEGYKRKNTPIIGQMDTAKQYLRRINPNTLASRLKSKVCELCGLTGCDTEIHQVKNLKNLKGKSHWEQVMIANRRKTLAVCNDCHQAIHA